MPFRSHRRFGYSLGDRSRLRRRLAAEASPEFEAPTVDEGVGADSDVPGEQELTEMIVAERAEELPEPSRTEGRSRADAVLASIRNLLTRRDSITWMFAGSSLQSPSSPVMNTYAERFAKRVRGGLGRVEDAVIDLTSPRETIRSVITQLSNRLTRFRPDVLSVMIGPADAFSGAEGEASFRRDLTSLAEQAEEAGIPLVLHAPGRVRSEELDRCPELRKYVRILREVGRDEGVPIVDHWAYWKQKPEDERRDWLADGSLYPSDSGHIVIAKLLLAALKLNSNSTVISSEQTEP